MRFSFVFPDALVGGRPFDFAQVKTSSRGTTGSEAFMLEVPRALARRGHDVLIYVDSPNTPRFEGVELVDRKTAPPPRGDVVVSMIDSTPLRSVSSGKRVLVNQNGFLHQNVRQGDFDLLVVPSETSARHHRTHYPWLPTVSIVPNGVSIEDFPELRKVEGRCVYASSPDRGLHLVLSQWPTIKKAVPHAELRVFYYALESYLTEWRGQQDDPRRPLLERELLKRAQYIDRVLLRLQHLDVVPVGSVSRQQLAIEFARADALLYPCKPVMFTETFSCTCMEACAAGATPILLANDCLPELYGPFVHPDLDAWTKKVIETLKGPERSRNLERDLASKFTWEAAADRFEQAVSAPSQPIACTFGGLSKRPKTIDFFLSPGAGWPMDPEKPFENWRGGGSPVGYLGLVKAMGQRGDYRVRAFSSFTRDLDRDGVEYRKWPEAWSDGDVAFGFYDVTVLKNAPHKLRIGSHHSLNPYPAWDWIDVHTAPSEWAANFLKKTFWPHGVFEVLPNGVGVEPIERKPVKGRVLWHTSVDRGLHRLLGMWPAVREKVPEATLHVVGDPLGYASAVLHEHPHRSPRAGRAQTMLDELDRAKEAGGVTVLGKVPRDVVLRELGEASVFAFFCDVLGPCETFSVSVMECLKVGIPVVLRPEDALEEVYTGSGVHTTSAGNFFDNLVMVLKHGGGDLVEVGKRFAAKFTFEHEAQVLHEIIERHFK